MSRCAGAVTGNSSALSLSATHTGSALHVSIGAQGATPSEARGCANHSGMVQVDFDTSWLALRRELWPDCPPEQHLEEMARLLDEPQRFVHFIVEAHDGRALGLAEASIRTDYVNGTASSPVAYLEGLYVRPEAREKGVARLLVRAVSRWASSSGCNELASDTQPENLVSRAVHAKLGFVETERAVFFSKALTTGALGDDVPGTYLHFRDEGRADPSPGSEPSVRPDDRVGEQILAYRRATVADLPAIVALLADDPLGARREYFVVPLPKAYDDAFAAIDRDPNNELVVVDRADHPVIGVLQLTFIPYLTYQGGWRALIEGVRVAAGFRSSGVGEQMLSWAVQRARDRGCRMVQLTSDKARVDAIRFYERLGFVASHEGMKLHLEVRGGG